MRNARSAWQTMLLLLLMAACTACVGRPRPPALDPGRTPGRSELLLLPESYRMVQRVRMNVRGRSLDFIGYLAVNGDCLRAIALMEVGGEVFDLLACAGRMSILKNPGRVPQAALKGGIMRELSWLFAPAASAADRTGTGRERITMEARIPGPVTPGELLVFRNGRLFSKVEIGLWQTVAGWPHPVPGRLKLKNMRWGYELTVELLRLDMRPVDKLVFSEKST